MKPSTELHDLIKSLTKSEKRFFKLHSSLQAGDKNYLRIFDSIDKQKVYDEEAIKKQFANERFIKHLPSEKNHLYKLILKALRSYHAESSISGTLKQEIKNIEILYQKALYVECNKLLHRAKRIARDNERLATHLFDLARALITARDLAEVAESVASIGTEALGADAIALCLFADAPDSAPAATSLHWLARDPALEAIARDEQILCGPIDVARAALLFRSQTPEPQSAALIGIGGDVPRGVLAIGSAEPGRYGAEAATDFLAELGRLVATATSLHWARTPAPA